MKNTSKILTGKTNEKSENFSSKMFSIENPSLSELDKRILMDLEVTVPCVQDF